MHSALGKVAQRGANGVILGGDFNTGTDSPIHAVLRNHIWHGLALAAAYEHPAAAATSQATECTFAAVGGHRYSIDHLFYSHCTLRPTVLLQALTDELRQECLGAQTKGLPDAHVPSDHIPIGAMFVVRPAGVGTSAPLAVPMTKAEEATLWHCSSNPLSPAQRQAWQDIVDSGSRKPKGKPTPEEIQELKEQKAKHLARERAFVADLSEERRSFIGRFKNGRAMLERLARHCGE